MRGRRAEDLVGQACVIDGDTLEIHGNRIRLWELMPLKATSFAVEPIVCCTSVEQMPPTNWIISLAIAS
jgi:hypothetical protein